MAGENDQQKDKRIIPWPPFMKNSLCDSLTRKETYDQRTFTSQLANETYFVKTLKFGAT